MYKMTFKSWENDADNYADVSLVVKTREDVNFYTELGKMFESKNQSDGHGNNEVELNILQELISELLEKHKNISPDVIKLWQDSENVYDNLCDYVLSHPVEYEYGFCRVVESIKLINVKPGYWLNVKNKDVVFISFDDHVNYREGVHPIVNGQIDIFKMDWIDKSCSLKDISFENIKEPTNVSRLVVSI